MALLVPCPALRAPGCDVQAGEQGPFSLSSHFARAAGPRSFPRSFGSALRRRRSEGTLTAARPCLRVVASTEPGNSGSAAAESSLRGSGASSSSSVREGAAQAVPLGEALTSIDEGLSRLDALRMEVGVAAEEGPKERELSKEILASVRKFSASGTLKGFGTATQFPRRVYGVEDLRLHKIDTSKFLSPDDSILNRIRGGLQLAFLAGLATCSQVLHWDQLHLLFTVVIVLGLGTADQIATGGAVEALVLDTLANTLSSQYRERVCKHEAGHFLIAYLLGVLPTSYTLSSLDALLRQGTLTGQQAGTAVLDVEFQEQVQADPIQPSVRSLCLLLTMQALSGKISSEILDTVTCIGLAGVCTEYILYGRAEGGRSDVLQLDVLFRSLGFTQKKSDDVVRWAVLNTVTLLRSHEGVLLSLAKSMSSRQPISKCIATIEANL